MRVLLADDHTLVRAGIRRLLEAQSDIEVVAEAQDGQECLDLTAIHRPDLALVDLAMPGKNGLDVLLDMRRLFPDTAIVMMSMHADPAYVRTALERGALGFVVKEAAPAELEIALRAALRGETFLSPKISARMLGHGPARAAPGAQDIEALPPRQREILRLLAQGKVTKEIAALLGISVKTVETHRARMMETLGIRRSSELLRFAVQRALDA
jgi:DNA-binding NarL/FixJ family response regulator